IIQTAMDFATILQHLTPEQSRAVCEDCQAHLPKIITTAKDFATILPFLTPEKCRAVCEACQAHLPKIITTAKDFATILCYLTPKKCEVVFETIKDHLPQLIQTDTDMEILNRIYLPDNVRLPKHYYLLASLDAYITQVEGHGNNDFSYSFFHQKTSRDLTQEVDYNLAKKIKETMIKQVPYTDIDELLSPENLKDMRDEIVTNLKTSDPFFNENYVERGMNSEALTKAFRLVRTPEFRQPSPGNGRHYFF
ncbi:MAG: hypothetical protein HY939_04465, partial [Gammaproteobacteria bacterium]|nr:hypothetical protein [Gammaproteobacteria bacterium]